MSPARVQEAYRLALAEGRVAANFENFRRGGGVRLHIPADFGFSDGVPNAERIAVTGEFQLRYVANGAGYAVFGRVEGQSDKDWFIVDGPWPYGNGPFDKLL